MHLNARILITGGAEFIGSHLTERLLADGNEVLCVDNFFTGPRRNIHHLLDRTGFELRGVRESLLAASPAERFETWLTSTIGIARLLMVLRVFCRRGD
jgi:nucleoside-diphosphate-sugar epimerase